jgi:hypothetical protein
VEGEEEKYFGNGRFFDRRWVNDGVVDDLIVSILYQAGPTL